MPRISPSSLPLLVVACAVALPGAAQATTYCVANPKCATGPGAVKAATLKSALDAAAANPGQDRVDLGAGTFPFPGTSPTVAATNDVATISGMGEGVTHLQASGASSALVVDRPGTVVSDLTVDAVAGLTGTALVLEAPGATARRVTVAGPATDGTGFAIKSGAVLDGVTAKLGTGVPGPTGAYVFGAGGGTIRNSTLTATFGLRINDADTTVVRNTRVRALVEGIQLDQGTVDVDGLLGELLPGYQGGIMVAAATSEAVKLTLRHATIANGDGNAVQADHYGQPGTTAIVARDVLITGHGAHFVRKATAGTATIDVASSAYDPTRVYGLAGLPGPTDVVAKDPGLVNAAGGDYALKASSPLVDRGEAALPAGGVETDLAGAARSLDGDGDGIARTDIGAYEYAPPPAPAVPAAPSAPAGATGPAAAPGLAPATAPTPIAATGARIDRLTLTAIRQRLDGKGRFAVRAVCDAAGGCRGTVRLTAKAGKRRLVLGTAAVKLADGARATVRVKLSGPARRALAARRTLAVTAAASVRAGSGRALPATAAFAGRSATKAKH